MAPYIVVFGVAALVTFLLTPAVWRLATRYGAIVLPDERRIHLRPTPTLGGAAMLAALYAGLVVAWWMPQFRPVFESSSEPVGLAVAATVTRKPRSGERT
jgi:UDP-GlcNAc:undecaprenyl-phosphate GlcNAc-1-phosphate transferase